MRKIFMIDLESTLTAPLPGPGMDNTKEYYLRPRAQDFLRECQHHIYRNIITNLTNKAKIKII